MYPIGYGCYKMPEQADKATSIAVKRSTRERLLTHGDASMSADEVLNLVLDIVDGKARRSATTRSAGVTG